MKKVILVIAAMILMVVCIEMCFTAGAEEEYIGYWETAMENMDKFLEEKGLLEYYTGEIDEYGIYRVTGFMNINVAENEYGAHGDWNHPEDWFADWYEPALEEHCPEYGDVVIGFSKIGSYNGTAIYYMTIAAENDLVDRVEGVQRIVDMMVAFYQS